MSDRRGAREHLLDGSSARVCTLALLIVLAALVPLAHASPPDPLWIPGIYDAADLDDVVVAVVTAVARAADTRTVTIAPPERAAAAVLPTETCPAPGASPSTASVRAPPDPHFLAAA